MIHQYKSNGYNIVMDVNSGAIHIVDDVVYDVLPFMEQQLSGEEIAERLRGQYGKEQIEEAVGECLELSAGD